MPDTPDEMLYRQGAKMLTKHYNSKENYKAIACGQTETTVACNWVFSRDTAAQAEYEAQANCEATYGSSCKLFAINGQLMPWAAAIADAYDPAGAPARQAAARADQSVGGNGPGFRNAIDGAIGVLGGVQGVLGAAQGVAGGVPSAVVPSAARTAASIPGATAGAYSQRQAFDDCVATYRAAGMSTATCSQRATNMNTMGPGAVRSTYGQGSPR